MFWHNFKYSLKTLFGDRILIFWTFAFPLILGTLFYMAFSAIGDSEKLSIIKIGIVDNQEYQISEVYRPALENLSSGDHQLFDLTLASEEELAAKLQDEEIEGFLKLVPAQSSAAKNRGEQIAEPRSDSITALQPELTFAKNGVNQTFFKTVIAEIESTQQVVGDLAQAEIAELKTPRPADIEKIYQQVAGLVAETEPNLQALETGKLDYVMVEYYTLIAMTCLYGGILGMVAINQKLANMSNVGKRVAVAPTRKSVVVLSSALAGYVARLLGLVLLFAYTILVLKVDYGEHVGLVILLALMGSLAGLALGIGVTTFLKVSENTKVGIMIAVTMLGCFFAGMMGTQLKYFFDQHLPFINAINPAAMITDGFYALYYYGTPGRYWCDILSLSIFAGLFLVAAAVALRRQKYDSI